MRASVVVAHGLSSCGSWALECSSFGAQALLLHGMWDLPGPGLKPVSPALEGRFLTTAPRGNCYRLFFKECPWDQNLLMGEEGSRTGSREKPSSTAGPTTASADSTGSFRAIMTHQHCPAGPLQSHLDQSLDVSCPGRKSDLQVALCSSGNP